MSLTRIKLVCALIVFLISANQSYGQTVNTFSGWSGWFSTTRISSKFSFHFDGQVRSNDEWKEVQNILLRPGLNYHISKKQIVTAGYGFINNHRHIGGVSGWGAEHRIWEQYIYNKSFSLQRHFTTLQHRLRLEQRFVSKSEINNDKLKTTDHLFSQRLRYFARSIFPFTKGESFKKGTFISLQNEVLVNLSNSPATNGKFFDQNRLYGSFGYRFSPKADLEIGYMNQLIQGRGDATTVNNILQIAVYTRL